MRIKPTSQAHGPIKLLAHVAGEAFLAEHEPRVNKLDIGPLGQGVLDDRLVLVDRDRAGRVDDEAASAGRVVCTVDGAEEELLLQVGESEEVALRLVCLDAWVLGDDAGAGAGGVEEDAVLVGGEGCC